MTIQEYIRLTDIDTYKKLVQLSSRLKPRRGVLLGDKAENLMKHDSYKRVKGKLVQRGWG